MLYLTTITKHYKTSQVLKILIITNFVGSRLQTLTLRKRTARALQSQKQNDNVLTNSFSPQYVDANAHQTPPSTVQNNIQTTETSNSPTEKEKGQEQVRRILHCFIVGKLWWFEMGNFIHVLDGIGCFGFWDVVLHVTVNLERIWHQWSNGVGVD